MERLDDDALAVAAVERSIGVNEQRRGNWAASEEMLRRALAAYAKAYDASHPESARLLLCLAALELDAGRPADAERDADRARAVLEGGAGDAEDLANAWTIRAEARLARGDREGGRSGLARAVEGLSAVRGERPVAYVIAASRLEAIDLALGRGPADATTEAPEDLADRTGVEARFARDYAAAIAAERSYAAGHLEAADDVGRSGEALEKTAYVDRLAVAEVRQWARAHTRR
jgi:hypothetical protein